MKICHIITCLEQYKDFLNKPENQSKTQDTFNSITELNEILKELNESDKNSVSLEQAYKVADLLLHGHTEERALFNNLVNILKENNILTANNLIRILLDSDVMRVNNDDLINYINNIDSTLEAAGILTKDNKDFVLQNVLYGNDLITALTVLTNTNLLNNDTYSTLSDHIVEIENITKILQSANESGLLNPNNKQKNINTILESIHLNTLPYIAKILLQLNTAKILTQETFDLVYQNIALAEIISDAFNAIVTSNLPLDGEMLHALYKNPDHWHDIIYALKDLQQNDILNSSTREIIYQHAQHAKKISDTLYLLSKKDISPEALSFFVTYSANNLSILTTTSEHPEYAKDFINALWYLNNASLLDSATRAAISQNPQHAKKLVIAITNLHSKSIFNPEIKAILLKNIELAENIAEALETLHDKQVLGSETQQVIGSQPMLAKSIVAAIKIMNIENKDTLIFLIMHSLDDATLLNSIIDKHLRSPEDLINAIKTLKTNQLFNSETQAAILGNSTFWADCIITTLKTLREEKLLDPETQTTACQNIFRHYTLIAALKDLKNNGLLTSETKTVICQNLTGATEIVSALQNLQQNNLLVPETHDMICQNPSLAKPIAEFIKVLSDENLFILDNLTCLVRNASHVQIIASAFNILKKIQKLTPELAEHILSNPKEALFIVETNGGKPGGEASAKDFCEIRQVSRILAQAWRENNSIFTATKPLTIQDLPAEMLVNISAAIGNTDNLDPDAAEYIAAETFDIPKHK